MRLIKSFRLELPPYRKINRILFTSKPLHHATTMAGSFLRKRKDTYDTLHMWTQIVGKIKLAILPWVNHSWHITLHITPTGLTTQTMPYKNENFQIDFDFIEHQLKITTNKGELRKFDLHGISVAEFYKKIFEALDDLEIDVKIKPVPVELANPIPFKKDTIHDTYDEEPGYRVS